jgi:putative CocE/NonD family hydrolase
LGGWFDAEDLYGALKVYRSIEDSKPAGFNALVMGPWHHGGWSGTDGDTLGNVRFNQKTSVFFREQIELPFFNFYLKGKGKLDLPEAFVFETGTNVWRKHAAWPPREAAKRKIYLRAGGTLAFDPPSAASGGEADDAGFDEYVSDPAKPVPYIPGISFGMTREHMVDDQRFASSRTDVLVYATPPLEADLTVAGAPYGKPSRRDDGDRLRLGGQAHRRLPRRPRQRRSRPLGIPPRWFPAALAGGSVSREVSGELRGAETV